MQSGDNTQMKAIDRKIETRLGRDYAPRRILMIVSNPATLHGAPVGFFAEELTAAFYAFMKAGHRIELASPRGGEVVFDAHSDPRTPNGPYADDLVSLGFVSHPRFAALMQNTVSIDAVKVADFDAVWVAGGGAPLLTFKDDLLLHKLIADFYERDKVVALVCHGSSLLLWARLSDGQALAQDKTWTGFSDAEEAQIDKAFGIKVNAYTIESEARRIPTTRYVCGEPNRPFAVRDGRLITGQQQYSSDLAAQLVLEALDDQD
ncbi:Putative intracellular protease/amidase [Lysobacter enzymogenes]|nr:Putative intracellular protease/amidase [Lysobacter enzymogenes]